MEQQGQIAPSISAVEISHGVLCNCITHALTTEKEEIMGLLLGDTVQTDSGETITHIWRAVPQVRNDRRKDRVECSGAQMAEVAQQAEQITKDTGRTCRVVGWYHSHPHITVLPSHIDVNTQASYQALDAGFVGLIVSCFNRTQGAEEGNRLSVIAFQSVLDGAESHEEEPAEADEEEDAQMRQALAASRAQMVVQRSTSWVKRIIPLSIKPSDTLPDYGYLEDLFRLQSSLVQEEWSPYEAEAAALEEEPSMPAKVLRSMHSSSVVIQSFSDLLQGSLLPSLASLHSRSFLLEQRRLEALKRLEKTIQKAEEIKEGPASDARQWMLHHHTQHQQELARKPTSDMQMYGNQQEYSDGQAAQRTAQVNPQVNAQNVPQNIHQNVPQNVPQDQSDGGGRQHQPHANRAPTQRASHDVHAVQNLHMMPHQQVATGGPVKPTGSQMHAHPFHQQSQYAATKSMHAQQPMHAQHQQQMHDPSQPVPSEQSRSMQQALQQGQHMHSDGSMYASNQNARAWSHHAHGPMGMHPQQPQQAQHLSPHGLPNNINAQQQQQGMRIQQQQQHPSQHAAQHHDAQAQLQMHVQQQQQRQQELQQQQEHHLQMAMNQTKQQPMGLPHGTPQQGPWGHDASSQQQHTPPGNWPAQSLPGLSPTGRNISPSIPSLNALNTPPLGPLAQQGLSPHDYPTNQVDAAAHLLASGWGAQHAQHTQHAQQRAQHSGAFNTGAPEQMRSESGQSAESNGSKRPFTSDLPKSALQAFLTGSPSNSVEASPAAHASLQPPASRHVPLEPEVSNHMLQSVMHGMHAQQSAESVHGQPYGGDYRGASASVAPVASPISQQVADSLSKAFSSTSQGSHKRESPKSSTLEALLALQCSTEQAVGGDSFAAQPRDRGSLGAIGEGSLGAIGDMQPLSDAPPLGSDASQGAMHGGGYGADQSVWGGAFLGDVQKTQHAQHPSTAHLPQDVYPQQQGYASTMHADDASARASAQAHASMFSLPQANSGMKSQSQPKTQPPPPPPAARRSYASATIAPTGSNGSVSTGSHAFSAEGFREFAVLSGAAQGNNARSASGSSGAGRGSGGGGLLSAPSGDGAHTGDLRSTGGRGGGGGRNARRGGGSHEGSETASNGNNSVGNKGTRGGARKSKGNAAASGGGGGGRSGGQQQGGRNQGQGPSSTGVSGEGSGEWGSQGEGGGQRGGGEEGGRNGKGRCRGGIGVKARKEKEWVTGVGKLLNKSAT